MNDFLNRRNADVPEPDPQLEQKLRTAMSEQADQFEPQADAYVRLQQRLEHNAAPSSARSSSAPRLMAMAAAVLVVFGMAGYFGLQGERQQLATDTPPTERVADDGTEEDSSDDVAREPSTAEPLLTEPSIEFDLYDGPIASALSDNPVDAAIAFLSLVRLDHDYQVVLEGTEVLVFANDADGVKSNLVSTLQLAARASDDVNGNDPDDMSDDTSLAYFVVKAVDPSIVINDPGVNRVQDSVYTVTGIATGWPNGEADLRLYSSNDGALLRAAVPDVGAGSSVSEFEVDVQLDGRDLGWIVVQTASVDGDALGAFSAVPIFYNAPLNEIEYQVAHIDVDDADGLSVRALPGPEERLRDSLPPGTSGIHRRGGIPNFGPEGSLEWWLVEYGDGKTGWVNARYLVSADDVGDDELTDVANEFLSILANPENAEDSTIWPADVRKPVQLGWIRDLDETYASELNQVDWWMNQELEWSLPPAAGEPSEVATLRDFVGFGSDALRIELTPDKTWLYGLDGQAAMSHFADLPSVTISVASADGATTGDIARKTVTLYVEMMEERPVVVGIAVWMWEP